MRPQDAAEFMTLPGGPSIPSPGTCLRSRFVALYPLPEFMDFLVFKISLVAYEQFALFLGHPRGK